MTATAIKDWFALMDIVPLPVEVQTIIGIQQRMIKARNSSVQGVEKGA